MGRFFGATPGRALLIAGVLGLAATPHAAAGSEQCEAAPRNQPLDIPGGRFAMGSDVTYPEERPARQVEIDAFDIDRYEVTNAAFAAFVAATGYVTVAERTPDPADYPGIDPALLVPGSAVFVAPPDVAAANMSGWWRFVPGASWRAPRGPGSSIEGLEQHPVVHIAYADALAYAAWAERRLPTEAEWERAARGGLAAATYAWGEELTPGGEWRANTWQGSFPIQNTGADRFIETAPVGCFAANPYGVYDMIGNVWEWTADAFDGNQAIGVIKGGSFLCSDNYCARYRPSARQPQERDFSASHLGFRTAGD